MKKLSLLSSEKLEKVNKLILDKMESNIPLIKEIAEYILSSGGKRIRPLLALSSARLLAYKGNDKDICLASAVELIHTATLLHDDVVDKSKKRRNNLTANNIWGNEASILVGDFLFSRAFELMVETNSLDVLKTLSQASCKISEGEMNQLISQNKPNTTIKEYIKIIEGKTAELFSAACKSGALIASDNQNEINALKNYGVELGIAYQLIDDALDYVPNNTLFDKSIGDDFKDGKISYPIIVSWSNGTKKEKKFWDKVIRDLDQDNEDFNKAIDLIKKYNGIEKTYKLAKAHSQNAIKALSIFKNSEDKESLIELAEFSVQRLN